MIVYNAQRESEYGMKWVLRDNKGNFLDCDTYSNDLKERAARQEIQVNFI